MHDLARMTLTPGQIDSVFAGLKGKDVAWIVTRLYMLIFPDYHKIAKIHGYPLVGKALSDYIWNKWRLFDLKYHPGDIVGSWTWMNAGFAIDSQASGWEVSIRRCSIIYAEDENEQADSQ